MKPIKPKSAGTRDLHQTIPESADGAPVIPGAANTADAPIPKCPGCDTVLMAGIRKGWVRGFCLRCPMCYLVCISG